MHPGAEEFAVRERYGLDVDVREFPAGTKTAVDAADAVGCDAAQIASSLVRPGRVAGRGVTSGANRARVEGGRGVRRGVDVVADPDAVREATGRAIGGVPAFCHAADPPALADETPFEYDAVRPPASRRRCCPSRRRRSGSAWTRRADAAEDSGESET